MIKSDEKYIHDHTEWLNSLGAATFVIDANNKVIFWSRSCEILTGVKAEDVLYTNKQWMGFYSSERPCLADMVLDEHWQQKTELYNHIERAPRTRRGLVASNWCQTPDGNKFLIFEANALFDKDNNVVGVIETLSDATQLKKMEEDLKIFSRAVETSSSSVVITDPKGIIEFVNNKFIETTGYSQSEALGSHIRIIRTRNEFENKEIRESIDQTGKWNGDIRSRRKDGSLYWDRCSLSVIKDETGKTTHYVGVQEDITHEYELAEKLSYEATHDQLTGLINRREFENRTEKLLQGKDKDSSSHILCFIDLDQFKVVNDTCGHVAGDELLKRVSKILHDNVRKTDTLARLGGDEFAVLMNNCELQQANRVASALLTSIQDYQFVWDGKSFRVGLSIGIVVIDNSTVNLIDLMRQADSACYMAKDLGRNRVHVYCPDDEELAKRHGELQWVSLIQKALNEDLFFLDAQSIVSLDESKTVHYELLIRMKDEHGKTVPPGAFLQSAERYNLITAIDRWVIKHAFTSLAKNPAFQKQINFVSINISGPSLVNDGFLEFILAQLKETGISGESICFEITETATITHMEKAKRFINRLKEYGCSFALDDFGSGLSSFAYLKNLPVDYLKIDGLFVKDIVDDPIDYALVKSINEVGQILKMKTVAEFVENDEIKGMLKAIGVDYGQGFGIGKPVPFIELLQRAGNVENINTSSVQSS